MFVIYGKRKLRIKKFTDSTNYCRSCKSFDLNVKVYKEYFHLFFIPFLPTGDKTVTVYCNTCGEPCRIESVQKEYEKSTRVPFYLYSGLILVFGLIVFVVFENIREQEQKKKFVASPRVGDVYLIRQDENRAVNYYFLRITQIGDDTIHAYHNNLVYSGFVSRLNADDFFDTREELLFTKEGLKQMLARDEINSVERNYGSSEGFDRLRDGE
jgi:hypothetical protein